MFPGLAMAQHELAQGWAWSGIAATTLENQAGPGPAPTPQPGDVCQTCSGSGKVGDGRVFQVCKDCNGTGKVTSQATTEVVLPVKFDNVCQGNDCKLVPAVKLQPQAVLQSPRSESICHGGVCYRLPARQQYVPKQQFTRFIRRGFIFRR